MFFWSLSHSVVTWQRQPSCLFLSFPRLMLNHRVLCPAGSSTYLQLHANTERGCLANSLWANPPTGQSTACCCYEKLGDFFSYLTPQMSFKQICRNYIFKFRDLILEVQLWHLKCSLYQWHASLQNREIEVPLCWLTSTSCSVSLSTPI